MLYHPKIHVSLANNLHNTHLVNSLIGENLDPGLPFKEKKKKKESCSGLEAYHPCILVQIFTCPSYHYQPLEMFHPKPDLLKNFRVAVSRQVIQKYDLSHATPTKLR